MSIDLIDIKIKDGKFVLDETGDFTLIRGAERIRQQIEFRLSLWAGEWFLDTDFGTPYRTDILIKLGASGVTLDSVVGVLREQIITVPGVTGILEFTYAFDPIERLLSIKFSASSEYGIIEINKGF